MSGGNIINLTAYRRLISANNSFTRTADEVRASVDAGESHTHDVKSDNREKSMDRQDVQIMLDTLELKNDLKFEKLIADSDRKFADIMADTRLKFSESQTQLAEAESKHAKWVIGLAFTMIAFVIGSVGFSTNLILRAVEKPRDTNIQAPPIIINVPSSNPSPPPPSPKPSRR